MSLANAKSTLTLQISPSRASDAECDAIIALAIVLPMS
jgi:hypothetical protein